MSAFTSTYKFRVSFTLGQVLETLDFFEVTFQTNNSKAAEIKCLTIYSADAAIATTPPTPSQRLWT